MFHEFCKKLVEKNAFYFDDKRDCLNARECVFVEVVKDFDFYKNHTIVNLRNKTTFESKQEVINKYCIGYGLVNQFRKGDDNKVKGSYFINFDPNRLHCGIKNKAAGILIIESQLDLLHFHFDICRTEEMSSEGLRFMVIVEGKPSNNFCIDLKEYSRDEFNEHIAFFALYV